MMKSKFSEFEADWAAMPQVEPEKLEQLKNKTIVISGHQLARCLCYALLYQNDDKCLNIKVIFAGKDNSEIADLYSDIIIRNDFEFLDFNSVSELKHVDYFIHTGICGEKINRFTDQFKEEIHTSHLIAKAAGACSASVVLLSDSRVYGNARRGRVYAENEYAAIENTAECNFENQLARTIEGLFNCEKKALGFALTTLRTGIVLGARTGIKSFLDEVFKAVANGEKTALCNSEKKYSFVYITDVFRAIVYSLGSLESNQIYNVVGIESTVSTGMLAAVLHDIYGAEILLTDGEEINACAISANKINTYGCPAAIKLETALALCVMSDMKDASAAALPNTHDGRLDAIQRVQLACLCEVDKICRKHGIKYFLGGGTLLGAIRHSGFIPWDDDSDIMMLREDYDKFCEIAPKVLPIGMTFQSNRTDKNCFYEFAKLRVDDTVFATGFSKEHRAMHNGVALDIFCHDKTANSAFGRKIHLAMTLFTRALVFNKWNNRKAENDSKIQTAVTNLCIRLFPIRFSLWLMNHTISFFKRKKNAKYLFDGMGRNVYHGSFPIDYLNEAVYIDFEGEMLPVPTKYDEYLRFLYGDYMELAPLSTRLGCHEILLCDIGKYDSQN